MMRNAKMTIGTMVLVLCFGLPKAYGLLLDDGQTHNIDWTINESVEVRNDFFDKITTVNVLSYSVIKAGLYAYERSQVTVSGGSISYDLKAFDSSSVTISAGQISNNLYAHDSSQVTVSDGWIRGLLSYDSSQVTVSGGLIYNGLSAFDSSQVTVSGGSIGDEIYAGHYSTDQCEITFIGSDFAINGTSVGYGEFDTGGRDWIHGILTGTLASGDSINNDFYIYNNSSIVLVPEPATLLLLGLGGIFLRKRKQ